MGFFSKSTPKKPVPVRPDVRPAAPAPAQQASAYTVAAHLVGKAGPVADRRPAEPVPEGVTVADVSMIEWASPGQLAFEVATANPGLCEALENAALLYASGKPDLARSTLEHAVQADHVARTSPLAWLALFDLLQRAGDRPAFDRVAMLFAVQFERSAPGWESRAVMATGPRAVPGGYIALSGKLGESHAPQIDAIRRAVTKQIPKARLDLSKAIGFDEAGARLLADALGAARRARFSLEIQHPEMLRPALETAVRLGREGGESAWLLSLELLQWQNDRMAFEDRAIEFAVAFELSPPSWEPPPFAAAVASADAAPAAIAAALVEDTGTAPESEVLQWSGTMLGSTSPQLATLLAFARGRTMVPIDMTGVERVDFVCAGAMLNAVTAVETQRKSVQIIGVSPIIRALLLLLGISPRHFVKRD
jgi:anti-anti-sigma regulatory factor